MAATNRNLHRCLALAGLVPVMLSPVFADQRQPDQRQSTEPDGSATESELRRQLRGKSYLLVQTEDETEYRIWLFDDDGSAAPGIELAADDGDEEPPDSVRWNQALVDVNGTIPEIRVDALNTLAEIDADSAGRFLRDALGDPKSVVRVTAIELLGETGDTASLAESWWQVPTTEQIHVVDALGDIETSQSTAFLRIVANSDNGVVAAAASQYLEERR